MKLLALLTTSLLSLTTLTTAVTVNPGASRAADKMVAADANNERICERKNPHINTLVRHFCEGAQNRHNLRTWRTTKVAKTNPGLTLGKPDPSWNNRFPALYGMRIQIDAGKCPKDKKYLPSKYCYAQFHHMCATGGPKGGKEMRFGHNGCQRWRIFPLKPGTTRVWSLEKLFPG
ncbi:hypothetical protein KC318_g5707 [Hortaea werneckii]|nr:hypothetical protein KC334_g5924 [Hortaea werneckii]KAI7013801.1 hypothetical protein KC355_g4912 [Hortaea werneckii]KAI7667706.1 hypothetical protein KC318_g5707 [Hortaea werneckii]